MLIEELRTYIGTKGTVSRSCEAVEAGAIRRFMQATLDQQRIAGFGGLENPPTVAPPLFPIVMFQPDLAAPDMLSDGADNPDFDGLNLTDATGLPDLPLGGMAMLNGGIDVEFYRYPQIGDVVERQSHYADIFEKQSSKGRLIFVVTETVYRTTSGDLLMIFRQHDIRR